MADLSAEEQPVLNIPQDLQDKIEELSGERNSKTVNPPGDLDDNTKRWLVVGICQHSILSPVLRSYVAPVLNRLYADLRQSDNIDTQTFSKHLKTYEPSGKRLNYETINNNKGFPAKRWGYNVKTPVDLSKLFLVPSMVQYTGFDSTCDLSPLLGIIINVDMFPTAVRDLAVKLRSEIRNPWGHCDLDIWDSCKYEKAFRLMQQLVTNLGVPSTDETRIVGQLVKWETNGTLFLQGTTVGFELLQEIKGETSSLAQYVSTISDQIELGVTNVKTTLYAIKTQLMSAIERIEKVENQQTGHTTKILKIENDIGLLKDKTSHIESVQEDQNNLFNATKAEVQPLVGEHHTTKDEIRNMKVNIEQTKNVEFGQTLMYYFNKVVGCIICIVVYFLGWTPFASTMIPFVSYFYLSGEQNTSAAFFYIPDRVGTFVGRENELTQLTNAFSINHDKYYMYILCGLGGMGKTTLATEFAWRSRSFYPGGVFWMSGESKETLLDSLTKLAIYSNTVGNTQDETLHQTLKMLSNMNKRWLLIVDNVDVDEISGDMKEILLGPWKRESNGHVIITSRREPSDAEETFYVKPNQCIHIQPLTVKESILFMLSRTGYTMESRDKHLVKLVEELGRLPLAIEQAAAHIKAIRCTFEEYLTTFRKEQRRIKLLRKARVSYGTNDDNRLAVKTTWQMNMEYIGKQSQNEGLGTAAVVVMEIVSFLYADDIPVEILNEGKPLLDDDDLRTAMQDSVSVKQVIEILTRFSLFHRHGHSSTDQYNMRKLGAPYKLSVHRLVQEVIRDCIGDAGRRKTVVKYAKRMAINAIESAREIENEKLQNSKGSFQLSEAPIESDILQRLAANALQLQKFPEYKLIDRAPIDIIVNQASATYEVDGETHETLSNIVTTVVKNIPAP